MAQIVRVSTEQANTSNGQLRNNLSTAKDMTTKLKTTVEATAQWWEGETAQAFISSFQAGISVFNKYLDKIQQHGDAMVNSVAKQQSHDQGLAKNIRKF